ncbi:Hypothetical protein D9617_7g029890 [Elsinoe fawcettii]|nr:Hypothetical protein D9617_7g029890 [Elsinoe fawcettii]
MASSLHSFTDTITTEPGGTTDHGRRYSAAAAQAVTFTEEELESVLPFEIKPPRPPNAQKKDEPAPVSQDRKQASAEKHISRIQAKVDAQMEEKTSLRTTKQDYLVTRHLHQISSVQRYVEPLDEKTAPAVFRFGQLLSQPHPELSKVWSAYVLIPSPRVCYISESLLTDFLALLRRAKTKHHDLVQQYFTVMSDSTASNRPLSHRDLNSALHWIGRSTSLTPAQSLDRALSLFHEFESTPHVTGDTTTFNTLGHLALKADALPLVRSLLDTMTERHLQQDRYTHLLRIAYAGRTRSVPSIRGEYRAMLSAGELIDTVTLNAVIRALLDARDIISAESTFSRMKELHASRVPASPSPPSSPYQIPALTNPQSHDHPSKRKLAHLLKFSAWQLRHLPQARRAIQDATPVAPDAHTYRMLVEHHAFLSGEFERCVELLEEALALGLRVEAQTWITVWGGFERHKGLAFGGWGRAGLGRVWEGFTSCISIIMPWRRGARIEGRGGEKGEDVGREGEEHGDDAGAVQEGVKSREVMFNDTVRAALKAWEMHGSSEELGEVVGRIREWGVDGETERALDHVLDKAEKRERRTALMRRQDQEGALEGRHGKMKRRKRGKENGWEGDVRDTRAGEMEMLWPGPEEGPIR